MIKIKQALFLVFGITSFIMFYIGLLNYLTTQDKGMGLVFLIFSSIVAIGTLFAGLYISKNITKPIESLAQRIKIPKNEGNRKPRGAPVVWRRP